MINDPRKNKFLEQLMNRPESLSAADVADENIDDALGMKLGGTQQPPITIPMAPETAAMPVAPDLAAVAKKPTIPAPAEADAGLPKAPDMTSEEEDEEKKTGEESETDAGNLIGAGLARITPEPAKKEYQGDPEITAALKKLKAGKSLDEAEVAPEKIDDPSMDTDLRKAALMKVKQKYLGK